MKRARLHRSAKAMRTMTSVTMWILLAGVGLIASGCGPKQAQTITPAGKPVKPLPAKALLKLDQLKPQIAKPVNPPEPGKLPPRARRHVEKAEGFIKQGNYALAVGQLERAIGFVPDNARIRRMLGLAYMRLPNWGKALDNIRRVAKAAPDDLEVQLLLGRLYERQKRYPPAVRAYRTALKCTQAEDGKPLTAETKLRLARLLSKDGYWAAALECYDKLEEWIDAHGQEYASSPALRELVLKPELLLAERGRLLMLLRRPAKAAKLLERAYRRNRTNLPAAKLLIAALAGSRNASKAQKLLVEMASEPALRQHVPKMAEGLCRSIGDKKLPGRIWRSYRQKSRKVDDKLAVALASLAWRLGDSDEAVKIARSVLKAKPGSVPAGKFLAEAYLRRGEAGEALELIARVLAVEPQAAPQALEIITRAAAEKVSKGLSDQLAAKAAAKTPESAALYYVAGELARACGDFDKAIAHFRHAIQWDEKFFPAYDSLLTLYVVKKQFREVDSLLAKITQLDSDSYFAFFIQGKFALLRGQVGAAVKALEQARARNPRDLRTLMLLADAYFRFGQTNDGERTGFAAMNLAPDDPRPYRYLFDYYIVTHQGKKAHEITAKLLKRHPDSIAGHVMMARWYLAAGQIGLAQHILTQLQKRAPKNVEVQLLIVRIELADKRPLSEARFKRLADQLRKIILLAPDSPHGKQLLGQLLSRHGKHAQAVEVWKRLYADTGERSDIGKLYADSLQKAGQTDESIKILRQIIAKDAKDFLARQMLLAALQYNKQIAEACTLAEKWLKEEQDQSAQGWYRQRLLGLYKADKKYGKAIGLVDDWIAVAISEQMLGVLKSEKLSLYAQAGQFDQAVAFAGKWAKDTPALREAIRQLLIGALLRNKQYDTAHKLLDEWIGGKTDKSVGLYRLLKIDAYIEAKKNDEAIKYAAAWAKQAPGDIVPRHMLIAVMVDEQKYAAAAKIVDGWMRERSGAQTKPAKGDKIAQWCRETAVQLLMLQQKNDQAIAQVDKYLKDDPENTELLTLKSNCLADIGQLQEAIALLEKVVKIKPDDPSHNNNLGYMYANNGLKLDRAEQLIRMALKQRPNELAFQDSLAWVFYKRGRFAAAAKVFGIFLARNKEAKTGHAVIYDHMGDTFYRLGQKDKAVKMWQQALKLAKDTKFASKEIKAILKQVPVKLAAAAANKPVPTAPVVKKSGKK